MKRILALLVALMLFCSNFAVFAQGSESTDATETADAKQEVTALDEQQVQATESEENVQEETTEAVLPEFTAEVNDEESLGETSGEPEDVSLPETSVEAVPSTAPIITGSNTLDANATYTFTPAETGDYCFKTTSTAAYTVKVVDSLGNTLYSINCDNSWYGYYTLRHGGGFPFEAGKTYSFILIGSGTGTQTVELYLSKVIEKTITADKTGFYIYKLPNAAGTSWWDDCSCSFFENDEYSDCSIDYDRTATDAIYYLKLTAGKRVTAKIRYYAAPAAEYEPELILLSEEKNITTLNKGENNLAVSGNGAVATFTPTESCSYALKVQCQNAMSFSLFDENYSSRWINMSGSSSTGDGWIYSGHVSLEKGKKYTLILTPQNGLADNVTLTIGKDVTTTYQATASGKHLVKVTGASEADRYTIAVSNSMGNSLYCDNFSILSEGEYAYTFNFTAGETYTIAFPNYTESAAPQISVEPIQALEIKEGSNALGIPQSYSQYVFKPTRNGEYTFTFDYSYFSYSLLDADNQYVNTSYIDSNHKLAVLEAGKTYYLNSNTTLSKEVNLKIEWNEYPLSADGFLYSTNSDGTVNITGYTGDATALVVPATVTNAVTGMTFNVKSVTGLEGAQKDITSVKFSEGIKSLGTSALSGYADAHLATIKTLEIPESMDLSSTLSLSNLSIEDLSGIKARNAYSISISGCDDLKDVTALKDILGSNGSVYIYSCSKLTEIALPERFSYLTISDYTGSNLDFLKNCRQLSSLNIYGSQLTDITGIANISGLSYVNLSGCTKLSNVNTLKGKGISTINLYNTKVSKTDAYDLIDLADKVNLTYVHPTENFKLDTLVLLSGTYGLNGNYSEYEITVDNSEIADITKDNSGWTITSKTNGSTTAHLKYRGEDTGKSFMISCDDSKPDPNQSLETGKMKLKDTRTVSVPDNDWQIWGLYDDNTLWEIGSKAENKSEKLLDNVKQYIGEYSYYRIQAYNYAPGSDTWSFVEKNDGTFVTVINQADGTHQVAERVKNAEKYEACFFGDNGKNNIVAFALTADHVLYEMTENATIPIAENVTDFQCSGARLFSYLTYLTGNGNLYAVYDNSQGTQSAKLLDSGVTAYLEGAEYVEYSKSGTPYYVSYDGSFTVTQGTPKIYATTVSGNSKYLAKEGKTYYWGYSNGEQYLIKVLDEEADIGKKFNDDGICSDDLLAVGSKLYQVRVNTNTKTLETKKLLTDDFYKFATLNGVEGYLLNGGGFYGYDGKVINADVLEITNSGYYLQKDNKVYFKLVPTLTNVTGISDYGNTAFFTRSDNTVWEMPDDYTFEAKKIDTSDIFRMGDINADNAVNSVDALQALRHSVNEIELKGDEYTRADVTYDGKVNSVDALQILRHSVGEITSF